MVARHFTPFATDADDTIILIAIFRGIVTTFHFDILHLASVIESLPILHHLTLNHLRFIALILRDIMLQGELGGNVAIDTMTRFLKEHVDGLRDVPHIVLVHNGIHAEILIIESASVCSGCQRDRQEDKQP